MKCIINLNMRLIEIFENSAARIIIVKWIWGKIWLFENGESSIDEEIV